jgi:4-alpha-glucanotransferase
MNYPFRVSAMDYLQGGDAAAFKEAMETIRENYPPSAFYSCMNMLGTHDNPRILTMLGTFPKPAPGDRTSRAYYRMSPEEYHRGCRLLQTGAILLYAFPGSPTIFYGDEAGMEGYEDPFNRGTFPWGREDRMLQRRFALLGSLRNNRTSLQKGTIKWLHAQGHALAFLREYNGERTIAATNAGNEPVFLTFPWKGIIATDALTGQQFLTQNGNLSICLPPLDGMLLV